jgi:hypothetical protein
MYPKHRPFDQFSDRPGAKAPEDPTTPDPTELKTEKSKTLSFLKVHLPALLFVHLHL